MRLRRKSKRAVVAPVAEPTVAPSFTNLVCSTCGDGAAVLGEVESWVQEPNRTGSRVRATIVTPYATVLHRCRVPRAA